MTINMQVAGKDVSFDSEQVLSYGSKEKFIESMTHIFNHVSEDEQLAALSSVYDKAVADAYPDHDSVDHNSSTIAVQQHKENSETSDKPEIEENTVNSDDLDAE